MVDSSQQVTTETEQIQHDAVHRQETLSVRSRSEPAYLPLALPRRLVKHLGSIILVLPGAVYH